MRGYRIKHLISFAPLALAGLALAFPLSSRAAVSPTEPGKPGVSTGSAQATGASVALEGSVTPQTFATTYHFEYGPTAAYGSVTASGSLPATTIGPVKVSETAPGMLQYWHYRLVAVNQDGEASGSDHIYTVKTKNPTKTKKNAFTLPKTFAPTPLGDEFVLSGTFTGSKNADREIVLQASPYPYRTFVNVGSPIFTGPTGAFSFRVANMRTSTKFRVSTVGGVSVVSPIVPAQVQARVVLKVRASTHKGLVRLYGTVTPAEVGARVLLQLEKSPNTEKNEDSEKPGKLEKPDKGGSEKEEKGPTFSTKFQTQVKPATKTISRFSIVVTIADAGHYRAFVELPSGPLVSGHSQTVLLQAATTKVKGKNKQA